MTRAIVIKRYGDPAISGAIADAIEQRVIPVDNGELTRLQAINGVRVYGDAARWRDVQVALAIKYGTRPHGRLYGAVWGLIGALVLAMYEWYDWLSAWNRR